MFPSHSFISPFPTQRHESASGPGMPKCLEVARRAASLYDRNLFPLPALDSSGVGCKSFWKKEGFD